MTRLSYAWILCLALPSAAEARVHPGTQRPPVRVWIVDDEPGIGVDFPDLQSAVDAAREGEVVLVRSGVYGGCRIVGKRLALIADRDASVRLEGSLSIVSVAAHQRVLVRGLDVVAHENGAFFSALHVEDALGVVLIEDCTFRGVDGNGSSPLLVASGHPGAVILRSTGIALVACSVEGGRGTDMHDSTQEFTAGDGATGVFVAGSRAYFYDCELTGGVGGSDLAPVGFPGGDGGHGAHIVDSFVHFQTTHVQGMNGGSAGCHGVYGCGDGGDGGDGMHAVGEDTVIEFHGCSYGWGAGGSTEGEGEHGDWGQPFAADLGQILLYPLNSPLLMTTTPISAGEPIAITVVSRPGERIRLIASTRIAPFPIPAYEGSVFPRAPARLFELGEVPDAGEVRFDLLAAPPPPGDEAMIWYVQGGLETLGNQTRLTGPRSVVVLAGEVLGG